MSNPHPIFGKNIPVSEVLAGLQAGRTPTQLADDFGCTTQNIYYLLKKYKARKRGNKGRWQ